MRKNMIKWRPFYSIPGLNKLVKEIEDEKKLSEPPILSSDRIESINYSLINAIENNLTINIKYWYHGMLYERNGYIEKVNKEEKYILVNKTKIYFKNIINVKI